MLDDVSAPAAVRLEGVTAGELRIDNIRAVGQVYNVFPRAEATAPIAAPLRRRLDQLLARHRRFGGRQELLERLDKLSSEPAIDYVFVTSLSGFGKTALLAK
jgi:hypothetical protein